MIQTFLLHFESATIIFSTHEKHLSSIHVLHSMEKGCDECFQQLKDSAELAIHMRQKHQKMYCGACKMQFSSKEDSLNHVKNIHGIAPNVFE